ncbi:LysR family transcriptional regulator [Sinorhizobium medicae]|uniref:LysR family transcriptional regulator n=1 Tax=Sinorhizobium medicae TaxID=110321 RepID=UPI002AF6B80E|nr:LysR family transcriptional regulator [Sinorhizobium medicae]WQO84078.1 LysR family transcriptional regulator [Sinorhizobium medicae]
MDWRRIDLNLLKVLAVMLEERSVARCAERLFVSPSAVSHALARLRTMFSDPLFVRTGSGMLPTARAQSLERSLSLLKALLAAELVTDRVSATEVPFEPGESVRDVRIVSPGALELSLLPTLATMLRARAPQWSLTIEPFERRSYETDLATGRVDFVLSVGGTTPIGQLVDADVLWEDEFVVLAGPRSVLHEGFDRISTELYLAQQHIYPLPWPTSQNYLDVELARAGRHRKIAFSVPSYAALGYVLDTTDLIASMPDRSARALMCCHPDLRLIHLDPPRKAQLSLLWGISALREPAISWVRTIIRNAAAAYDGADGGTIRSINSDQV